MKAFLKFLAVAAVASGLTVGVARANAVLELISGTSSVSVTDNGAGDLTPALGAVTFSGSVGAWTLTVDTGTTKPMIGSVQFPAMDLSFHAVGPAGAPLLYILFSDDGFNATGSVSDSLGGTMSVPTMTVWDGVWLNKVLVGEIGTLTGTVPGPNAFSEVKDLGTITLGPGDVLKIGVVVSGGGIITGDKYVAVPDGGVTAMLLGLGLLAIGAIARRIKA